MTATGPIADLLARLQKVKTAGPQKWQACCPAHEDRAPSLSIATGDDGRVLLHCQAGCTTEAIVHAIGMELSDLFQRDGGNGKAAKLVVATYDYCNLEGELLYQVCRYHPKDFRQRRPDGNGGWIWNLQGVERVLHRLLEPHDAEPEKWVLFAEGEKDVENLVAEGLCATCNVGGAGKWRDTYSETLRGRKVAVIPDNDKPGEDHAAKVADALQGIAAIDADYGVFEGRTFKAER